MKRNYFTFAGLMLIVAIVLMSVSFTHAAQEIKLDQLLNAEMKIDTGGTIDTHLGTLKIVGVEMTSSAAELNKMDGVTATTAEINTAADVSSRVVAVAPTNGAVLTLSAATPVVILTPAGGANDTTNTITIATPYPVGVEFSIMVAVGSTNLALIADSTTVLALGSDWTADETDTLKFYTVATNQAFKVSSSDN